MTIAVVIVEQIQTYWYMVKMIKPPYYRSYGALSTLQTFCHVSDWFQRGLIHEHSGPCFVLYGWPTFEPLYKLYSGVTKKNN